MKKILITILILMVSASLPVAGAEEEKAGEKKIPAELLRKDLEFLVRSLEEIHPDLYANLDPDLFKTELKQVMKQIKGNLSTLEFYKLTAPLVAGFGDAHTSVTIPYRQIAEHVRGGGKILPFDVDCRTGKVIIKRNYSDLEDIVPGMEIVEINGYSGKKLIKHVTSFLSPRKEKFRFVLAGDLFSAYLYLLYGFDSDFSLELKKKSGSGTFRRVVPGETLQVINKKRSRDKKDLKMKFSYKHLPKEKAALMVIESFSGSGNYWEFLRDSFKKLRQEKVEYLIIDIRKNNGGDSRLSEALADYISHKPLNLVSRTHIRASRQVKQMFRERMSKVEQKNLKPEVLQYLNKIMTTPDGKIIELKPDEKGKNTNSLRFSGKVYLLTGVRTFSSAVLFAAAFKDHKLGLVVGEETGAPASHFGEIYAFKLPNSQLNVRSSYKYFVRPSGKTGSRGVIPHHRIPEEQALEYVFGLIKKNRRIR